MNDLTPAQLFKSLRFDEVKMETKLAKEYLEKHDFESMLQADIFSVTIGTNENQDYRKVYKVVAQKIRENATLFAQLENLARKFNPNDIIRYDVPMIVKQFEYFSSTQRSRRGTSLFVNFTPDLPLAILGFGADTINCTYQATRETIAVVFLFTTLCQEAGFILIDTPCERLDMGCDFLYLNSRIAVFDGSLTNDTTAGSVVVVTGQSDVDSAVEGVLCATRDNRYPWHVRRVIVQESVYDRFKAFLTNKAASDSRDAFEFDYAGSERDTPLVLIEAYRTTKELLALLEKYQPLYLSLWGNDISTTNEVAIKSSAYTVWINNFGVISTATFPSFYSGQDIIKSRMLRLLDQNKSWSNNENEVFEDLDRLLKIRANWAKKSVYQRKAMIAEVISKLNDSDSSYWSIIREEIPIWEPVTFAEVNGGLLSFGFQIPHGAYFVGAINLNNEHNLLDLLKSIVLGNGILFQCETGIFSQINTKVALSLKEFEKSGVPLVHYHCSLAMDKKNEVANPAISGLPLDYNFVNTSKAIFSNFGETFAN